MRSEGDLFLWAQSIPCGGGEGREVKGWGTGLREGLSRSEQVCELLRVVFRAIEHGKDM